MDWITWILVGIVAGYMSAKLLPAKKYGKIIEVAVSTIGAVIGGWILYKLYPQGGAMSLLSSALVASIAIWLYRLAVPNDDSNED